MSFTAGPFTVGPFQAGPFRTGPLDMYGVLWDFAGSQPPTAAYGFRRTGLGTLIDASGNVVYGDHNLLLNSATLSTQNVTTVAQQYTLKFSGAGTVTLSGTGSGVLSAGTNTFTATAGTLTLTVSGSVTTAQLNAGAAATAYVETAGAAVYLPRYTYHPTTHAALGLLIEPQVTNGQTKTDDLTAVQWTKTSCTATGNAGADPFGGTAAESIVASAGSYAATAVNGAATAMTPGALTSGYFYLRQTVGSSIRARLSDGATGQAQWDVDTSTGVCTKFTDGPFGTTTCTATYRPSCQMWRIVISGTQPAAQVNAIVGWYFANSGDTVLAYGGNTVSGVDTSDIPNPTSGSLVRTTDGNWDITGSDFTQLWGSGSERTIVVEWYDTGDGSARDLVAFTGVSNNYANSICLVISNDTTVNLYSMLDGVYQATTSRPYLKGTLGSPVRNKAALAITGSGITMSINGSATSYGAGALPDILHLRIAGAIWEATTRHILKSLSSRPTALTGAALQALSAL